MFTIYGTYKNSDEMDGRGPMILVTLIADHNEAVKYIEAQPDAWGRQREWRGNRYGDWELREHPVFESVTEIDDYKPEDIKNRVLAKLTPEERRALGF